MPTQRHGTLPAGKQPGLTQTAAPRAAPLLGVLLPACFVLSHQRSFTAGTESVLTGCAHMGFVFPRMQRVMWDSRGAKENSG